MVQVATYIYFLACREGVVRLRNSTYTYDNGLNTVSGRVDVCSNGTFLPICDVGWDDSDAQVVCRDLQGSNYSKQSSLSTACPLLCMECPIEIRYSW